MEELHIIGVDLAKRVFQVHGSDKVEHVLFRKKPTRPQFRSFLCEIPNCTVAMEACSTAHHWGRQAKEAGHIVRLISPNYVKPFVKRHKNDAVGAEAIIEADLMNHKKLYRFYTEEKLGVTQTNEGEYKNQTHKLSL
jgi:transposase